VREGQELVAVTEGFEQVSVGSGDGGVCDNVLTLNAGGRFDGQVIVLGCSFTSVICNTCSHF
jgi:hypothetical protein